MKFSTAVVLGMATLSVAQNHTTKASKSAKSTSASATATGKSGGSGSRGNATTTAGSSPSASKSSSSPIVTVNAAPIAASNAGAMVTIAGLGVAFALFM